MCFVQYKAQHSDKIKNIISSQYRARIKGIINYICSKKSIKSSINTNKNNNITLLILILLLQIKMVQCGLALTDLATKIQ